MLALTIIIGWNHQSDHVYGNADPSKTSNIYKKILQVKTPFIDIDDQRIRQKRKSNTENINRIISQE